MKVRVLLFARLRELAGSDAVDLELSPGASLADAWRRLQERVPALSGYDAAPLMARNLEFASGEEAVRAGDEIAFFPPVSGG
jgi:molybdopterin converting factor subunit 1